MIANCPSCGTHYKHEPPPVRVRARCGNCHASLDLARLRPYRIVSVVPPTAEQARRAARHLPIGLDHPSLATTIAENVARHEPPVLEPPPPVWTSVRPTEHVEAVSAPPPVPETASWEGEIPSEAQFEDVEFVHDRIEDHAGEPLSDDEMPGESAQDRGGAAAVAMCIAAGAIAGVWASRTMGGDTLTWTAAGAALGAISRWVWLQWPSPK